MHRVLFALIVLLSLASCGINMDVGSSSDIKSQIASKSCSFMDEYASGFNFLTHAELFKMDQYDQFDGITFEEVVRFSESVKGTYIETSFETSIFPQSLISAAQKILYSLDTYSHKDMDNRTTYFGALLNRMGESTFEITADELFSQFPNLNEHKDEFEDVYEVYEFFSGMTGCFAIYRIDMRNGDDRYIFLCNSGGSDGAVYVSISDFVNGEFLPVVTFYTQNWGFSTVIQFEDNYYYAFFHYNYNLKAYDGIRIHRISEFAQEETVLIKYLPSRYFWKNMYILPSFNELEIAQYIDAIKEPLTQLGYIDTGIIAGNNVFIGDEELSEAFPLSHNGGENEYYKIDFTNSGKPLYVWKSLFEPSNTSTMRLNVVFYTYDNLEEQLHKLDSLSFTETTENGNELMQMWFKDIQGMVFTFRVYRTYDYNYLLNVSLIYEDQILHVRSDIFSPEREFQVSCVQDNNM